MKNEIKFFFHGDYITASMYTDTGRLQMRTGEKYAGRNFDDLPRDIQRTLDRIRLRVEKHVSDCNLGHAPVTKQNIANIIKEATGHKIETSPVILDALKDYIKKAVAGEVFNRDGKLHSDNTILVLNAILYHWENSPLRRLTFGGLTELHFTQLQSILTRYKRYVKKTGTWKSLSKNTIATYNNMFAAFIEATLKIGWHTNKLTRAEVLYIPWEEVDYPIYYSIDELSKLYKHPFSGSKERIRDVFVFGCFTCLRHSDYYRTDYKNAVRKGELITDLKKGSNRLTVPLHPVAIEILEKYGYVIPKIGIVGLDKQIKTICRLAGFTEPVLFSRTEGGVKVHTYKEKWELTSSHTMRRSYATNALKMGSMEWEVMMLGGWKSEQAFRKYKRMSQDDANEAAKKSAFFKVEL